MYLSYDMHNGFNLLTYTLERNGRQVLASVTVDDGFIECGDEAVRAGWALKALAEEFLEDEK